MRNLLLTTLLAATALAGCLDDGTTDGDLSPGEGGQGGFEMPSRAFEPRLVLDAPDLYELEMEQGETINLTFDITDLHDYPFPLTFVDWNLTYNRDPNPVLEGDAHALAGTYNRILHAEAYHVFTLNVDDGQGFNDSESIVIKVGDPEPLDVDPIDAPVTDEVEILTFSGDITASCIVGCWEDAYECEGWATGVNNQDCYWFEVDSSTWGSPFTQAGVSDSSDVDTFFYTSCDHPTPDTPDVVPPEKVGSEFDLTGTIPIWTGCVVMFEFGGPIGNNDGGTLSMEITLDGAYDGDPWADIDEAGMCHATQGVYTVGNADTPAIVYVHDRESSPETAPGVGFAPEQGGGTWIYEEGNGVDGLQLGGAGESGYSDCANPDILIF